MKKIFNISFYIFITYLILMPIFLNNKLANIIFISLFIIFAILFIFSNFKRIKLDIKDLTILLIPLGYIIILLFKNNLDTTYNNLLYIIKLSPSLIYLIILKHHLTTKIKKDILKSLLISNLIYFFIPFIYLVFKNKLILLSIFTCFGDQYPNSISRFYGTFYYCNSSALFFCLSIFISYFFLRENTNNKYYLFTLYISSLGFLSTYSKMVFISYILIIINLVFKKRFKFLKRIYYLNLSLIIPLLLGLKLIRYYLSSNNLIIFLISLIFLYLIFITIYYLISKIKIFSSLYPLIILTTIIILILKPISLPFKIKSSSSPQDFILTDFILESNQKYQLEIDYTLNSSSKLELYYLYVEDYIPKEKLVGKITNKQISFTTTDNAEYYYLKIINLSKETNLIINELKINNIKYSLNYLLIPYEYLQQLKLIKYDKESVLSRFTYYKDSLRMLKDKGFLLGHGLNTFSYLKNYYNITYPETNPHSHLLNLFLELGIIGLIHFLFLTILSLPSILNTKSKSLNIYSYLFLLCYTLIFFEGIYSNLYLNLILYLTFILNTSHYHKIPS